jgi:NAD-dependent dihydropyrimidine dehydrogenase PreA subunit
MRLHAPTPGRSETAFIRFNSRLCEACWKCVEACPNGVLVKINLPIHKHARIVRAENCKGCKKCVNACTTGALEYTYVPKRNAQLRVMSDE